jgi:signal recognition particle subunit SEC65
MILHKRLGRIIEREVSVDAVVTGELEEAVEVMGLGAAV